MTGDLPPAGAAAGAFQRQRPVHTIRQFIDGEVSEIDYSKHLFGECSDVTAVTCVEIKVKNDKSVYGEGQLAKRYKPINKKRCQLRQAALFNWGKYLLDQTTADKQSS